MSEAGFARLHAWIDGHVQGVGFRAFVYEIALSQELSGWVRNTHDGLVEVLGEGPRENLDILLAYLRRGPRGAYVTDVRDEWSRATGEYTDFKVTRTI